MSADTKNANGASSSERETEKINPIFSPRELRAIAYCAVALTVLVSIFVLAWPWYLEVPNVRTIVCVLLSLAISLFFFVFWPQEIEVKHVPIANIPVRVAGPVVLWFVVLQLFLFIMPTASDGGQLFFVRPNDPDGNVQYFSTSKLRRASDGSPVEASFVPDPAKQGHLGAVFVKFKPGESEIEAEFATGFYDTAVLTFRRGERMVQFPELTLKED